MDKLHHEIWIVQAINAVFGPIVAAGYRALGWDIPAHGKLIPDHIAMLVVLSAGLTILALLVRSRLSVDNPGKLQIVLEDFVTGFYGLLDMLVGHKGRKYLPIAGTVFVLIWVSNMAGLVPGLMAPTSNVNVPFGCALTVWVYYHFEGIRAQGLVPYVKHFAIMPGVPLGLALMLAPLYLVIELISHTARVLSLTLRLFGNVFGEELVILILASLVPFVIPLPMMFLGVLTGTLQAGIFVMLTMIYLGGAVATEHEH